MSELHCECSPPCPPIDSIITLMTVWRITTTTTFIWEKATRLPERAQARQSWPPKSQIKKMQYMHRKKVTGKIIRTTIMLISYARV